MYQSAETSSAAPASAPALCSGQGSLAVIGNTCIHCKKCLNHCDFLHQNGTPGSLARSYTNDPTALQKLSFSCSLCGLCNQVCPLDLEPAQMFLDLRREAVSKGRGEFPQHKRLLRYEKLGGSALFKYLQLPPGCTRLFFPGCALPGSRPQKTLRLYSYLQQQDPTIGIMLDCCNKPSHDLGRDLDFQERFRAKKDLLISRGITGIITSCPSCHRTFSEYGQEFTITTVYSMLAADTPVHNGRCDNTYTIHDACSTRFNQGLHQDIRTIGKNIGIRIVEMEHSSENTLCCGEGGAAGCLGGGHAGKWSSHRYREAGNKTILTYCAGCATMLYRPGKTNHIIDLLFEDSAPGQKMQVRPPMTYLNRLGLKRTLIRNNRLAQRTNPAPGSTALKYYLKRIITIAICSSTIVAVLSLL